MRRSKFSTFLIHFGGVLLMGVLLIAMITTSQVMFSTNPNLKDDYNLSDVPGDIHNYFMEEIDDGDWLDAKTNGVNLNISFSQDYAPVALQFNFSFYGVDGYETLYVASSGYISLIDTTPTTPPYILPSANSEYSMTIIPLAQWFDGSDNIYAWSTPEFCVIQYDEMFFDGTSTEAGTFQAVLYPDGTIDFKYLEILSLMWDPIVGLNFGDGEHFNSYSSDDLDGITDFTLRFHYYLDGPELAVRVNGPVYTLINSSYLYTAFAMNLGITNESGRSFSLYLNDAVVNSTNIPNFGPLRNYTLTYNYTGTVEGLDEIKATIQEVPGEFTYENNEDSIKFVTSIERNYAIFQDRWPWGVTSTTTILSSFGIPYDIYSSSSMGMVDLSDYTRVIISSSQSTAFRQRVYDNLTWFENYAANGGILEIHAADQESEQWVNGAIPGGVTYTYNPEESVNIVAPWHQILNVPKVYSDDILDDWGSSIHGYLTNVTPNTQVILTSGSQHPALIEFPYSDGHIIITTQTVEYAYESRLIKFLENLLLYRPIATDHEVLVNMDVPTSVLPLEETVIELSVSNWGSSPEENVVVTIHANEELIYSNTILSLENGTTFSTEIDWTPEFPGTCELTAYVEPVTGEVIVDNNEMTKTVLVRSLKAKLLWFEGYGGYERGDFSQWVRQLQYLGYQVDGTTDTLNETTLAGYSAIIFAEPQTRLTSNETDAIQAYVMNGGGLFAIGDSYQDPLNNLTQFAGIEWLNEPEEIFGYTDNITAHQVTDGVEEIYFNSPVSRLNLTSPAIGLVFDDLGTRLAISEVGDGKVVAIAEDGCLDDDTIQEADNLRLGNNIINWLTEGHTYNIITNIVQIPLVVNSTHIVNVTCDVTDFEGVDAVMLYYRVNGSTWQGVQMTLVGGNTYQGSIPAQPSGTLVEYYISATNVLGYTTIDNNNGNFYSYTVTTPTATTTTTTGGGELPDTTMIIIIIAGAGGVILVIVILYLYKKKSV